MEKPSNRYRAPSVSRKLLPTNLGAILVFTEGEEKGRSVPLVSVKTILGRKFGDILVRDIKVSGTHAAVEYREGRFYLVDLDSSNGTFLGNRKIRSVVLEPGQECRIGLTAFRLEIDKEKAMQLTAERPMERASSEGGLVELLDREFISENEFQMVDQTDVPQRVARQSELVFIALLGPTKGKKFSFKEGSIVLGRIKADINLLDPDVSRKHATIERDETGQVILRDLASTNGTFVNDRRIANCVLNNGDRIKLGATTLLVTGVKGG